MASQQYSISEFAGLLRKSANQDYSTIADDRLIARLISHEPEYREFLSKDDLAKLDGLQPIQKEGYKPIGQKLYEQYGSQMAPGFFKQIGHQGELMAKQIPSAFLGAMSWMVDPVSEKAGKYLIDKAESVRKHFQESMIQDIVRDPELQALYAWRKDEAATFSNFWHYDMFQRLLANAVPSIIGMSALALGTRGASVLMGASAKATTWAGRIAGMAGASGLEGSALWNEAMRYLTEEEGLSNEEARDQAFGPVAVASPLMGLMEYLPFARVLKKSGLGTLSRSTMMKQMSRRFRGNVLARISKASAQQALFEGATEWMQEMTGALAAQSYMSGFGNTYEEAFDNFAQVISGNWNTPEARESFFSGTAMGLVMGSFGGINSSSAKSLGKAYDKYKASLEADVEAGVIDAEKANNLIKQFKTGLLLKGTLGMPTEDAAVWMKDFEEWTGEKFDSRFVPQVSEEGTSEDTELEKVEDLLDGHTPSTAQTPLKAYLSYLANPRQRDEFYDLDIAEDEKNPIITAILGDRSITDLGIKLLSIISKGGKDVVDAIDKHSDRETLSVLAADAINKAKGEVLIDLTATTDEIIKSLNAFAVHGDLTRTEVGEDIEGGREFIVDYEPSYDELPPVQAEPTQEEEGPDQVEQPTDEQMEQDAAETGARKRTATEAVPSGVVPGEKVSVKKGTRGTKEGESYEVVSVSKTGKSVVIKVPNIIKGKQSKDKPFKNIRVYTSKLTATEKIPVKKPVKKPAIKEPEVSTEGLSAADILLAEKEIETTAEKPPVEKPPVEEPTQTEEPTDADVEAAQIALAQKLAEAEAEAAPAAETSEDYIASLEGNEASYAKTWLEYLKDVETLGQLRAQEPRIPVGKRSIGLTRLVEIQSKIDALYKLEQVRKAEAAADEDVHPAILAERQKLHDEWMKNAQKKSLKELRGVAEVNEIPNYQNMSKKEILAAIEALPPIPLIEEMLDFGDKDNALQKIIDKYESREKTADEAAPVEEAKKATKDNIKDFDDTVVTVATSEEELASLESGETPASETLIFIQGKPHLQDEDGVTKEISVARAVELVNASLLMAPVEEAPVELTPEEKAEAARYHQSQLAKIKAKEAARKAEEAARMAPIKGLAWLEGKAKELFLMLPKTFTSPIDIKGGGIDIQAGREYTLTLDDDFITGGTEIKYRSPMGETIESGFQNAMIASVRENDNVGNNIKEIQFLLDSIMKVMEAHAETTAPIEETEEEQAIEDIFGKEYDPKEHDDEIEGNLQIEGVSEQQLISENKSVAKRIEKRLKKHFGKIISAKKIEGVIEKHGKTAVGMALDRLATWSVTHGTLDTIPHEYAHIYIELMSDSAIVKAGIKQFKSEEDLVQYIGEYYADRIVNRSLKGRIKKWLTHFINRIKLYMGIIKPADLKDIGAFIAEEMYAGRWMGTKFARTDGVAKFQEAPMIDPEGNPDGNSDPDVTSLAFVPSDIHTAEFFHQIFKIHIDKHDFGRIFRPLIEKDLDFPEYLGQLIEEVRKYSKTRPDRRNFNENISEYQESKLRLEWNKAPFTIERHIQGANTTSTVRKYLNYIVAWKRGGDPSQESKIIIQGSKQNGEIQNKDLVTGKDNNQREMSNFVEEDLRRGTHAVETLFLRVQDMLLRGRRKKDKKFWYQSMSSRIAPKRFYKMQRQFINRFVKKYIAHLNDPDNIPRPPFHFIVSSKAVNQGSAIYVGQVSSEHMDLTMEEVQDYWEYQLMQGNISQENLDSIMGKLNDSLKKEDKEYFNMSLDEAMSQIQEQAKKKGETLTKEQLKERLHNFIQFQTEARYKSAVMIGRHEWYQSVTTENYMLEFTNLDEFMARLSIHFSEGMNARGAGTSKVMILDDDVDVFIRNDDGTETAAGKLRNYDGQTFSAGRWFQKIADIVGLKNLFELKTVIRSRQKNDIDGRYTNLLGAKHMQFAPFENMIFKRDGRVIARSIGGFNESYFVDRNGVRFDHVVPSGAAKQHIGLGSTNNFSEQDVVHTINDETDVKILSTGLPKDSNTAAFPVNLFDMILDPTMTNNANYKALIDAVTKHYGDVAKEYLDLMFSFRKNPKALVDFMMKDIHENEHPVEVQQFIQMIKDDGRGVHHKAISQFIVSTINNRMVRDGIFKGRNMRRGNATNLYLKPMGALDIQEGSVIASSNNKVMMNQVIKKYMEANEIKNVKEFWTKFVNKKAAVEELNEFLKDNTVEVLIHRQPINKIGAVKMWKVQSLEYGQHGQVLFMRSEDVLNVLDGDWDGDKILLEFIPESLSKAINNFQNSDEIKALNKTNNIDIFGPRHKDADVVKDFLFDDDIFNTISDNAKNTGSVGMIKVASAVMTSLRSKLFSMVDLDGVIFEPFASNDVVVMDEKQLDFNQITKNDNEFAKEILDEGGFIVKRVTDKDGKVSYEEVPIEELGNYEPTIEELNAEKNIKTYKGVIDTLEENQIFVFGSNEGSSKGGPPTHGKGAANIAKRKFGAVQGQPRGLQGQSYGIVTKKHWDKKKSSTPEEIKSEIRDLYDFAIENPDKEFMIPSYLGMNLSGYTATEMANMFSTHEIPTNIVFEEGFSKLVIGLGLHSPLALFLKTTKMHEWNLLLQMAFDNPKYGHLNDMSISGKFLLDKIFKVIVDGQEVPSEDHVSADTSGAQHILDAIKQVENTAPDRRGEANNRKLTLGQITDLSEVLFERYFQTDESGQTTKKTEQDSIASYIDEINLINKLAGMDLLKRKYTISFNQDPTPTEQLLMLVYKRYMEEVAKNPDMDISRVMSSDIINFSDDFLKLAHVLAIDSIFDAMPAESQKEAIDAMAKARAFLTEVKVTVDKEGHKETLIGLWLKIQKMMEKKSTSEFEQPIATDYNEEMIQLVGLWARSFAALPEQVQIESTRLFLAGVAQNHIFITKILPLSLMHNGFVKKYLNAFEDKLQGFKGTESLPTTGVIRSRYRGIQSIRALYKKAETVFNEDIASMDELLTVCGGRT